ncbi:DUF4369 domain-containing protein [Robertkochia flava]|uniref:DUF4369 domain-containing protein n=1 Tax=Robertkochia flava TaxID=3447986 RepID=UPI001CC9D371|nr:DUF4369 domain-containing protein [Robertkochia marina]
MPRLFASLLCGLLLVSCADTNDNMVVKGTIEGLKKGTLYFQKVEDTALVTLDSIEINGNPDFSFSTDIESPEMFYLYLDKADGNDMNDQLEFFGEPGEITIHTTHDFFAHEARVEGSDSHKKLKEYRTMMGQFSGKNLNLIKESLEAQKEGNQALLDSLNSAIEKNNQRGYLYTVNFVFNNRESFVTPYLVLSELSALNEKYLDSINNSIAPEVAQSKYGKQLAEFVEEIKKTGNTEEAKSVESENISEADSAS